MEVILVLIMFALLVLIISVMAYDINYQNYLDKTMDRQILTLRSLINEILVDKISSKNIQGIDAKLVVEKSSYLLEELGLDSLDVMEVIIECEGATGLRIPNKEIKNIKTKDDIHRLFAENAQKK